MKVFFGFLCGVILTSWVLYWFSYREQQLTIISLTYHLKEKNTTIAKKNKELIELYKYIILLEKQPIKPAPMWTYNE